MHVWKPEDNFREPHLHEGSGMELRSIYLLSHLDSLFVSVLVLVSFSFTNGLPQQL